MNLKMGQLEELRYSRTVDRLKILPNNSSRQMKIAINLNQWSPSEMEPGYRALPCKRKRLNQKVRNKGPKAEGSVNTKRLLEAFPSTFQNLFSCCLKI
jgi:hypothetical protein